MRIQVTDTQIVISTVKNYHDHFHSPVFIIFIFFFHTVSSALLEALCLGTYRAQLRIAWYPLLLCWGQNNPPRSLSCKHGSMGNVLGKSLRLFECHLI